MSKQVKDKIRYLMQAHRPNEAETLCLSICNNNKQDAEAWFILGSIYGQLNKYQKAIDSLQKSISIQGNIPLTHYNLGLAYIHTRQFVQARESLEKALKLDPGSAAIRFELANTSQAAGDPESAIPVYKDILKSNPNATNVRINLASACTAAGNNEEAINTYRDILATQGDSAEILFLLGNALRSAGKQDDAEKVYRRALHINEKLSGVLNNLGLCLHDQGKYPEAIDCFEKSLTAGPGQPDPCINMAKSYQELRQTRNALKVLEKAAVLNPDKPETHWDLSLVLLKLGCFEKGWKEYEWRHKRCGIGNRETSLPCWDGSDISSKTILVVAEQGIGDEIMFSSCFPDMSRLAKRVIIECEERLAPLFKRSFPACEILQQKHPQGVTHKPALQGIDLYISAGSIPQFLRKTEDSFPVHRGYLRSDPEKTQKWENRYKLLEGKISIGISWKGGHISKNLKRSTTISHWSSLLKTPGVNFVNLQYGEVQADIDMARNLTGVTIHHWPDSDPLSNMDDFAAQISALDMIISVDNSTVHLAGALGIPAWLLQQYSPDWRWKEQCKDSYWYPSIRQFHQQASGDWDVLMNEVGQHLKKLISEPGTGI